MRATIALNRAAFFGPMLRAAQWTPLEEADVEPPNTCMWEKPEWRKKVLTGESTPPLFEPKETSR